MNEFIIDNDDAYNDYTSLVNNGEMKVLEFKGNIARVDFNKTIINIEFLDKYMPVKHDELSRIINGKNAQTNIVNISVDGDTVYLFTEKNGVVEYTTKPFRQWVLANKAHGSQFKELKGNQHFKYIKEYNTYAEYDAVRKDVYRMGCFTIANKPECFMTKEGYTYFKNTKVNDVSVLSFDIETSGLDPDAFDAQVFLITNAFRKNGVLTKKTFNVAEYENQYDMITDWCKWVREIDPSLVIGHNIMIYDLPYMSTIMLRKSLPMNLGRLGRDLEIEDKVRELRVDGSQTYSYKRINIFGRDIIDTFFLAIKADIAKKYVSYGLKSIIAQEGLEKPGRQHYDASTIKDNWNNLEERKKIIEYAEDDADDSIKLYDIMIAPFFYLTPHIPKPFQMMVESATGSQLNSVMVRSYIQDGFSVAKATDVERFEGAISFGNPGIYDNVFKVDVASLYPSIMRLYKIAPKGKDFNGNFLRILEHFTLERLKNKKLAKETNDRYYKDLEQAQKVVINSAYGFMGATGLNYNYGEGAAEVTKYGREIITKAVEWASGQTLRKTLVHIVNKGKANEKHEYEWRMGETVRQGKGYIISNCDTDSISFTANRELSETDRTTILDELNSLYDPLISFADDGYFKRVIVLKAKNYILFDGKKIKLKGSSLKDQKKEPALREMMNRIIETLVHGTSEQASAIYQSYVAEINDLKDIMRWCTKKSVSKAILNCRGYTEDDLENKRVRKNETSVWDAIADIPVQEGDKIYLYPAILSTEIERKEYKNGKVKEKVIKITGLKRGNVWSGDHDVEKLQQRIDDTVDILSGVMNTNSLTI